MHLCFALCICMYKLLYFSRWVSQFWRHCWGLFLAQGCCFGIQVSRVSFYLCARTFCISLGSKMEVITPVASGTLVSWSTLGLARRNGRWSCRFVSSTMTRRPCQSGLNRRIPSVRSQPQVENGQEPGGEEKNMK